jgi:hypothetical protein
LPETTDRCLLATDCARIEYLSVRQKKTAAIAAASFWMPRQLSAEIGLL